MVRARPKRVMNQQQAIILHRGEACAKTTSLNPTSAHEHPADYRVYGTAEIHEEMLGTSGGGAIRLGPLKGGGGANN